MKVGVGTNIMKVGVGTNIMKNIIRREMGRKIENLIQMSEFSFLARQEIFKSSPSFTVASLNNTCKWKVLWGNNKINRDNQNWIRRPFKH